MEKTGKLYLVATPIGNLEDITLRALRTLKEVDIIAAEDTRQTLKLLNHFDIKKSLISYYEHNKLIRGEYLIKLLLEGKNIALVSDAGTPAISDPGEDLVKQAIESGLEITMIPGPVAAVTGLVLSGLSAGRFAFEGFLSVNKRIRKQRLNSIRNEVRTMVFYEAPHKLLHTLKDLYEVLGDRRIALARELTKKFEQLVRCTLSEAVEKYTNEAPKGEFVVIVEGADQESGDLKVKWESMTLGDHIQLYLSEGMDKKQAMKKVADDRGISRRDVYNSLIKDQ